MKIRVSYGRLQSERFNNERAEASIEVEVLESNADEAFAHAWTVVRSQVNKQFDAAQDSLQRLKDMDLEDVPF